MVTRLMGLICLCLGGPLSLLAQPYAEMHGGTGGMWLPVDVQELVYADMQQMGISLSADSLYDSDGPDISDGVVRLDGGSCTAEAVSPNGLLFTNHHCAFDAIAELSSAEDDLLKNGFWAPSHADELPIPGGSASFLIRSENVTEQVMGGGAEPGPEQLAERIEKIKAEATEGTHYEAEVKSVLYDNAYYLFVYETFTDVRFVGAPGADLGKFGRDQDNWVWPRHTADFAILRVYAGADNKPAEYSPDNQPYQPRYYFPISLEGIEAGDFQMVMGYPAQTTRYLTSYEIEAVLERDAPAIETIGSDASSIMSEAMAQNATNRIALAGDFAGLMNAYKYYQGMSEMLERYDIVEQKQAAEEAFGEWAAETPARQETYGAILGEIETAVERLAQADQFTNYLNYTLGAPGFSAKGAFAQLVYARRLAGALQSGNEAAIEAGVSRVREAIPGYFKEFVYEVDKELFAANVLNVYENVPQDLHPAIFEEITSGKLAGSVAEAVEEMPTPEPKKKKRKKKKKKKDTPEMVEAPAPVELPLEARVMQWVEAAYATAIMTDEARLTAFLDNPSAEALTADPLYRYMTDFISVYGQKVYLPSQTLSTQIDRFHTLYMQGLQEMYPDKKFYPDANSTMRYSFGKVTPYEPRDGVTYSHYTTLEGVMEKYAMDDPDYLVPERLIELYDAKDYGRYGEDGKLVTCFINTTETSGGGSGSPVINGKGEIVGIAFDGNWEAMTSDIHPLEQFNRTIVVDIRYVLFIIDKLAEADRLIDELMIRE